MRQPKSIAPAPVAVQPGLEIGSATAVGAFAPASAMMPASPVLSQPTFRLGAIPRSEALRTQTLRFNV